MLIFVTGAAGFIGRAVTEELRSAGHQVLGLVRSDAAEQTVNSLGAKILRGDIEDLDSLRTGASQADGIVHLAFTNDFANFARACEIDRNAIQVMAKVIKGTNKPLVITKGTLLLPPGQLSTEDTEPIRAGMLSFRALSEDLVKQLSVDLGIRSSVVRLSPTVHDVEDKGFVMMLAGMAKKNGFVAYIPGDAHWPAVPPSGRGFEMGRAGAIYHGIAEEGVWVEDTLTAIANKTGLPLKELSPDDAGEAVGFFAHILHVDNRTSSVKTREELDGKPKGITLLEDIEQNYFKS